MIIVNTKYQNWLGHVLQFLPVTIFLVQIKMQPPLVMADWERPYFTASVAVLFVVALVWRRQRPLHGVFVGIHSYLVSGSLALMFGFDWLSQLYGQLQASAMLFWVLIIGVFLRLIIQLPITFAGAAFNPYTSTHSWYFFLLVLLCAGVSMYGQGNIWLEEFGPFVLVFISYRRIVQTVPNY